MSYLPPSETTIEEVQDTLEVLRSEHKALAKDISYVRNVEEEATKLEHSIEECHRSLDKAHASLKYLIERTEQLKTTYDIQIKQLQDHFDFLSKEQNRIKEWEILVNDREQKHYSMPADTGYLGADFHGRV